MAWLGLAPIGKHKLPWMADSYDGDHRGEGSITDEIVLSLSPPPPLKTDEMR